MKIHRGRCRRLPRQGRTYRSQPSRQIQIRAEGDPGPDDKACSEDHQGWRFDAVSIGDPNIVRRGRKVRNPPNLGTGWVGFNFEVAFERPVTINDAAMQALGGTKAERGSFWGWEPDWGRPHRGGAAGVAETAHCHAARIDALLGIIEAQSCDYRDSVLLPSVHARLAVEAGVTQGWRRYVGGQEDVIGVDRFGASAPGPVVMREYGFNVENVCKQALALLEKKTV